MVRKLVLLWTGSVLLGACGGAPVPHDQLSAAQAAVRAAEVGGAKNEPQAALHMKKAEDQIAQAKALIEEDENEEAARILRSAEVDAELALSLAQEQSVRNQAIEAQQEVQQMRDKMKPPGK